MALPRLAPLILPFTRAELPGWHRLYRHVAGDGRHDDPAWRHAGHRTVRGKWHGYRMQLDLADWSDRTAYFLGRYYETQVQQAMLALLRPGDRVLDIGANTGMLTLLAAAAVGPHGRVDAFEPNPACCQRIRRQLDLNRITHVHLHELALSDQPGHTDLHSVPTHTGFGTLAPVGDAAKATFTQTHRVAVACGDDVLTTDVRPLRLVKIDVEGFECHALTGLRDTLLDHRPAIIGELNPYCLERAGRSARELLGLLSSLGYAALEPRTAASRWRERVVLHPLREGVVPEATDLVWLPRERPWPTLQGGRVQFAPPPARAAA